MEDYLWEDIEPSLTEDEHSETETITAREDISRETLEDELQNLQFENIKLKYKASKNEIKHYQIRLNKLESKNKTSFIYDGLENSVIELGKAASIPLMFSHLK